MIKEEELFQIKGGASKWTVGFVVGAVVSFIAGLIDGFMRPLGCNG
jgi:lactobin A/cerein 7B family class IIb bacteriocin